MRAERCIAPECDSTSPSVQVGIPSGRARTAFRARPSRARCDDAPVRRRFAYRLGPRSGPVLRLFGVRGPENAWVDLTEDELIARFGAFEARTPIANIERWRLEGPWRWITAIGVRRGIRHGDITFGGSHEGGMRLDLRTPTRVWRLQPRTLYLTVADPEALAAALEAHDIPGDDARRR